MKIFETRKGSVALAATTNTAYLLIVALLLWATGAPVFFQNVNAANLTLVSDTLSDSDRSVLSRHTIVYTNATSTIGGQTIKIQLDPDTHAFTQAFSSATTTDITFSGVTIVTSCGGADPEVTAVGNYNNGSDENLTFTVCAGDTIPSGTKTITIGAVTNLWTNPSGANSYRILIAGTQDNTGTTRVAIIDDVVVTASVDTSLTFTVTGMPTGIQSNGVTTSTSTTATEIAFGTLSTGVNSSTTAAQRLNVATNAANGFTVTVKQDQNLLSSTGADIDVFKDGEADVVPTAWTAPSNTLGDNDTYGHFGLTSDDDLNTNEFGTALFVGNFATTSRAVFHHNGPSDGTTANIGSTTVAYRIAITALQEAAADYTNTLTYVATPIF